MSVQSALVVHFDDLRLIDHRPLTQAVTSYGTVYGLTVIDPAWFDDSLAGMPRMGSRRLAWRLGAIEDLRSSYQARGGDLLVRVGSTATVVAEVAAELGVSAIYGQKSKTAEESAIRRAIELSSPELDHHWVWNDILYEPELVPPRSSEGPASFTYYRKHCERKLACPPPVDAPERLFTPPCDPGELPALSAFNVARMPIDDRSPIFELRPGESGAWQQLEKYIWEKRHIHHYKKTRNGMTKWEQSSRFSPYLALGCLSPRSVMHQIVAFENRVGKNDSTYWLTFELLWRDYFHWIAYQHGNRLFRRDGLQGRRAIWQDAGESFKRWCDGETGWPLIDACMRELAETGYMSNRGRQLVASYLTKERHVDWRLGAYWFEHHLIDYDPCSNWGNWQYVAGVGTDVKDRKFDIRRQAQMYDPRGQFVKRWVTQYEETAPELLIQMNQDKPGRPAVGTLHRRFDVEARRT